MDGINHLGGGLALFTLGFEAFGSAHAAIDLLPGALWDQDGRCRDVKGGRGRGHGPAEKPLLEERPLQKAVQKVSLEQCTIIVMYTS